MIEAHELSELRRFVAYLLAHPGQTERCAPLIATFCQLVSEEGAPGLSSALDAILWIVTEHDAADVTARMIAWRLVDAELRQDIDAACEDIEKLTAEPIPEGWRPGPVLRPILDRLAAEDARTSTAALLRQCAEAVEGGDFEPASTVRGLHAEIGTLEARLTRTDAAEQRLPDVAAILEARADDASARWSCGIAGVDRALGGGLPAWGLVTFACPNGHGKTAFGAQAFRLLARQRPGPIAVVLWEPSREEFAQAVIAQEAAVARFELQAGAAAGRRAESPDEHRLLRRATERRDAIDAMLSRAVVIDRAPTVGGVAAAVEQLAASRDELAGVVVDYLQRGRGDDHGGKRDEAEVGEVAVGLEELAKRHRIPAVALAQINRTGSARIEAGGEPRRLDVRGSGQIEQSSHVVLIAWRRTGIDGSGNDHDAAVAELQRGTVEDAWTPAHVRVEKSRGAGTGALIAAEFNMQSGVWQNAEDRRFSGSWE